MKTKEKTKGPQNAILVLGALIVIGVVLVYGLGTTANKTANIKEQNQTTTYDTQKQTTTSQTDATTASIGQITPATRNNAPATTQTTQAADPGYQTIYMNVTDAGWQPSTFVLKKGVPVKWIINGQQLNGCNNGIKVPSLGLQFNIKAGEQTIEFTPTQAGTIQWSCWMGMIQGQFIVKDNIDVSDPGQVKLALDSAPAVAKGKCGCGMM